MEAALGRLLTVLEKASLFIAQIALFAMMAAISIDALGRYLFNNPLPGGLQLTELYFMVILAFLGMPATYATGGHIRLDAMRKWLDKIPYTLSERLNSLLAGTVFGVMAWQAGLVALEKIQHLETSYGAVQFPIYLSYVWVPIGCGLLALRMAYEVVFPRQVDPSQEIHEL
jgi:TRAP-type C4-dicarboxylate transport system permease small subunit